MKKLITLAAFSLLTLAIFSQFPEKISYQFVVRNSGGTLVINQAVGVRFSILQGTPNGTVIYKEIFSPNPVTNVNGLVTLEIGTGIPVTGSFTSINWADGPYYLESEIDPNGAANYTIAGTSQLVSVPYAYHAKMAESIPDNSISSVKIIDETISTEDLANSSVTSDKITDGTIVAADLANSSITTTKIADGIITNTKLAPNSVDGSKIINYSITAPDLSSNSVTSDKIANGTIVAADLANSSITTTKIADASVTSAKLASKSVTSEKIVDGTITADDIQNRLKNIVFPANALNFNKSSTILTQASYGIYWNSDFNGSAYLTMAKPVDWFEKSDVTLKLYFMVAPSPGGEVVFFIRPRAFNSGDTYSDASSILPDSNITIPDYGSTAIYSQSFTIPASRFGTKSLWLTTIQRKGAGETYTNELTLLAVEVIYTAVQ